jgi:phosphatidylglycerophosphate synthase
VKLLLESLLNSINEKKILFYNTKLKIKQNIPNIITLLRLIALPTLIYSFNYQSMLVTFTIFLASIATDIMDGYVARKLSFASKLGTYLDVFVDFLFITGMYLAFIINQIYSPWILLVIVFVFTQFILSNIILEHTIYDPIGKYFGSILFAGIGVTILSSDQLIYDIVTVLIVISALASLLSRLIYLLRQRK